jgi:hypothetical protein
MTSGGSLVVSKGVMSSSDGLSVGMALSLANGGASRDLGLKIIWVQGKGGRTDPGTGPGQLAWADRPRPIPARFGRPFAPVGPYAFMHFAPLHLHHFDDVTLASKMKVLRA